MADIVRLYRKLSPTAINEHRKLDLAGSAIIIDSIQGRADGAPGEKDIVD